MMKIVTRNFGWKVACVAAAFLLWLIFSGARDLTTSISVPVQYRNIPKNLEISSNMIEQVHLILRGPSPLLSRLSGSQLPVVVDLGVAHGPGLTTFTLDRRNVALPSGVVLERTMPAQVQVRLETRVARDVPVQPRLEHVPDDKRILSVESRPATLNIIGPESRVAAVDHVDTDPVDVRALDAKGEIATNAFSGDPRVVFTGSSAVTLRVTLAPKK